MTFDHRSRVTTPLLSVYSGTEGRESVVTGRTLQFDVPVYYRMTPEDWVIRCGVNL